MIFNFLLSLLLGLNIWQDSAAILSPRVIAIVTALVGLVFALVGMAYFNSSRAKGVIGFLLAAYGTVTPFISSFPRTIGMVLSVIGLIVTLTSERIQGGVTDPAKRAKHARLPSGQ